MLSHGSVLGDFTFLPLKLLNHTSPVILSDTFRQTQVHEKQTVFFFFKVLFWRDHRRSLFPCTPQSVTCMPLGAAGREERSVDPMFDEDESADFFTDRSWSVVIGQVTGALNTLTAMIREELPLVNISSYDWLYPREWMNDHVFYEFIQYLKYGIPTSIVT